MSRAPIPLNEAMRLKALHNYEILDSVCEQNFDDITRLAARLCDCPMALISLVDSDRQWFKAKVGLEVSETHRDLSFCAHAILDASQPLIVTDATQDCRFSDNDLVVGPPGIRFYAGIPLITKQGFPLGTLCVIDTKPRAIDTYQLDALRVLAQSIVTSLDLRQTMRAVGTLALSDQLTGLPNRTAYLSLMSKSIERQKRDGHPFGIVYIDLDGMKRVNDQEGHAAGDQLLVVAAKAIAKAVRGEDSVARLGGDEFACLVNVATLSALAKICERIRLSIKDDMLINGFSATASLGGALFAQPAKDESHAIAVADALMYAAKSSGKDQCVCRQITSHIDDHVSGLGTVTALQTNAK